MFDGGPVGDHMMNNDLPYPRWQACYRDALVELDQDKLIERVREAERAIGDRLEVLPSSCETLMEMQAIRDALANLRCLKRETLGASDRSKSDVDRQPFSEIDPETGKKAEGG